MDLGHRPGIDMECMEYEKRVDEERFIRILKSSTEAEPGIVHQLACNPHFHGTKEFLFVCLGEQEVVCDGESDFLTAGDVYFTDSFSLHAYEQSEAQGYVLMLSDFYFSYFNELYPKKTLPCSMKNKQANERLFKLIEEWYEQGTDDVFLNIGYTYKMLGLIINGYGVKDIVKRERDDVILQMLEYVEQNYKSDIDLAGMAEHIKYSVVYCSKIWNRYVRESFRDYVNRCRVYHVNEELRSKKGKKSILQIAFDNGFNSQSTFYRAYKKVYGRLPTEK